MTDWFVTGLEDDLRPRMFELAGAGEVFGLATIAAANGGPRPVGSQMVVSEQETWGFLSGGCIEADVAIHAREAMRDGAPRRLVYGQGSPFIDTRLPCGSRLELLVERVPATDPALARLAVLTKARQPARWRSDGRIRRCEEAEADHGTEVAEVNMIFTPPQRLAVVGSDPFALAIAALGGVMGWETTLIRPFGPISGPPFPIAYSRARVERALAELRPDTWTAIAVATHDPDLDHEALVAALRTAAGYVGLLGARRRLPERLARLREAGLAEAALGRLRAPIGLPIAAANPREVGLAVIAEIVATMRGAVPATPGKQMA